jgi:anion-transporting  ArsA/GET3 family ATPase
MLDMKRTFDEIVIAHADKDRARQILENPFYQALSSSFAGTQEYMAMEKLGQLRATGEWDLIVVDTPPSRSALDFLDAPERLGRFLDGRLIRVLMAPARAGGRTGMRIMSAGFGMFTGVLNRIVGGQLLRDISLFVNGLDTMFGGFRERADATYHLLKAPGTAFIVVAAPEKDALREAAYFVERLASEGMPLAGLVLNRMHAGASISLGVERAAAAAEALDEAGHHPVAAATLRLHADRVALTARERRLRERFTSAHPTVALAEVTAFAGDVHDLDGLRDVGRDLADPATPDLARPA